MKKRGMAILLAVLVAAGSWAGLLAGWNSAQTMGQRAVLLPKVTLRADGGISLTAGERRFQMEGEKVKVFCGKLSGVELLLPRSLRIAGLGALAGLFLLEQEQCPAVGEKRLAGGFGAAQKQWL